MELISKFLFDGYLIDTLTKGVIHGGFLSFNQWLWALTGSLVIFANSFTCSCLKAYWVTALMASVINPC